VATYRGGEEQRAIARDVLDEQATPSVDGRCVQCGMSWLCLHWDTVVACFPVIASAPAGAWCYSAGIGGCRAAANVEVVDFHRRARPGNGVLPDPVGKVRYPTRRLSTVREAQRKEASKESDMFRGIRFTVAILGSSGIGTYLAIHTWTNRSAAYDGLRPEALNDRFIGILWNQFTMTASLVMFLVSATTLLVYIRRAEYVPVMSLIGLLVLGNASGMLLSVLGSLSLGRLVSTGWVCGALIVTNLLFLTWYLVLHDRDWMTGAEEGPFRDIGEAMARQLFGDPP
jgi:hypothetical protein